PRGDLGLLLRESRLTLGRKLVLVLIETIAEALPAGSAIGAEPLHILATGPAMLGDSNARRQRECHRHWNHPCNDLRYVHRISSSLLDVGGICEHHLLTQRTNELPV